MTQSPGLIIRRPRDMEGSVCRMLLRGLDHAPGQPEVLVAAQPSPPQIAGALSFRRLPKAFASLRLRVVRTERRRGIGTALLLAALADARRSGVGCVSARADSGDDPHAAAFLGRHGFIHATRLLTMEGNVETLRGTMRLLRERLSAKGRIPQRARIISFPDAPRDQVARLYADHIAHNPELAARLAAPAPGDARLSASPVAMVGADVAGFVLWSMEGTVAHVHAKVVAPAYRGRWANAVLTEEAFARFEAAGAARTRFEVLTTNHDTLKLARRLRADTIDTQDVYRLDLGSPGA